MPPELIPPKGAPAAPPAATPVDIEQVKPRLIPGSDEQGGDVEASPEEQAQLDQVISKSMMMIHGAKARDVVLQALHNPRESVPAVVGRLAAKIIMTIAEQKAASTNQPLDKDIMREAAGTVVPELLDVGIAAGLFPIQEDKPNAQGEVGEGETPYAKAVQMSLLEAVKTYGEHRLRQPGAQAESEAAGDEWANNVNAEVRDGTADPEYMQAARPSQLIPPGAAPQQGAPK